MERITIDPITRLEGHGKIEIFLLQAVKNGLWQCLIGGRLKSNALETNYVLKKGQLKTQILKKIDNKKDEDIIGSLNQEWLSSRH